MDWFGESMDAGKRSVFRDLRLAMVREEKRYYDA